MSLCAIAHPLYTSFERKHIRCLYFWNDNLTAPQVKPLKTQAADAPTMWTDGPHLQFGIGAVLCEGGSHAKTKELNQAGGVVLVKSIAEFYNTAK